MSKPLSDTQKHVTESVQEDTVEKKIEPVLLDVDDSDALCPLTVKFASAGQAINIWHESLMSHTRGVVVHTEPWRLRSAFADLTGNPRAHAHTLRASEKCEASIAPHRAGQMAVMDFASGAIFVQMSALVATDTSVSVTGVYETTPDVGEFRQYRDYVEAFSASPEARLVLCSLNGHICHELEAGESLNVDESRVLAWTANADCVVGKHAVRFTGPGDVLVQIHSSRSCETSYFEMMSCALAVLLILCIGLVSMVVSVVVKRQA